MSVATIDSERPRRARVRPWGRWGLRGAAVTYVLFMVAVPVSAVLANGLGNGLASFWSDVANPVAVQAFLLTIFAALLMTLVNGIMGTLTAYALVRYDFPGRSLLNGLVDLPFAIPTLVTGLMIVVLYGPQHALGAWLQGHGLQVVFATPGIILALLFVTYPFVIRSVQPVLMEAELRQEEAAFTLGASKWLTFKTVLLPTLAPALASGCLLSFARALGEFGSIVVVAGNIPRETLTAPVYIYGQIESHNQRGASAMSSVLLLISFALILTVDWLHTREARDE